MIFRYKLADNEKNLGTASRSVNGILLFKNRWFYSDKRLFTDSAEARLAPLITEESAETRDGPYEVITKRFTPKDMSPKVEKPKEIEVSERKPIKKTLAEYTKEELSTELLNRGFTPTELRSLSKKDLADLIRLDNSLEI